MITVVILCFVIHSAEAEQLITPSSDTTSKKPATPPSNIPAPTGGEAVTEEVDSRPEIPGMKFEGYMYIHVYVHVLRLTMYFSKQAVVLVEIAK